MPRTVPVSAIQAPGNLVTGALWNAGPAASNTFLTTPPIFEGYQGTSQSLTINTLTPINLDNSVLDTDGQHSNVTNNSRFICQVAGWYWVYGIVAFAANSSGARVATIAKNGTAIAYTQEWEVPISGNPTTASTGTLVQLAINDYLELWGYQTAGTLSTFTGGPQSSLLVGWWHS
jgi:hypothetical protein